MSRVLIAGGGAGGLALANFLGARGIEAVVFEQASRLGEVGAGVQLAPNGIRMLDRIGLREALQARVAPIVGGSYHRKDGTPTLPTLTTDSAGEFHVSGIHRADLIDLLAAGLPDGTVRVRHRATAFEQSDRSVTLRFADGSSATGDILVAADGIHSAIRAQIVEPSQPVHSGSLAYRGLVRSDELPDWPRDHSMLWLGEHKHFLTFPVRRGELINYVGFLPTDESIRESWSATGDPDALRAAFDGWDPRVTSLLAKVESTFWWGLYDREPISRWGIGRVTLLGDAAHPMLPHLGQGVNQAIEDAATLALLLAESDADDAPSMLRQYEELRRGRTGAVQAGSRTQGSRFDASQDLDRRDEEMRASQAFRLGLFDHDAEVEARAYLEEALGAR